MNKNKWVWIIAGLMVVAGLVISNILSNQKEPMRRKPEAARQKSIPIITVQNKDIKIPIEMSGPLYAYDKVELFAEVSGILLNTTKHFKAGTPFKKGEVLIKIDDRVYKNNVLAQKSSLLNQLTLLLPDLSIDFPQSSQRWETYLKNMDLQEELKPLPEPVSDKERYYIASRNIYNQYYVIKGMETTLSKYTLRAPFAGVVSQSLINPGTLVRVGQKLGEFISTEVYEMEASVSLFDANRLEVAQPVNLTSEDVQGTFTGHIRRINRVLDPTSLTVKVYIHLQDPRLRDGMYMVARAEGMPVSGAVAVAKDLLVENSRLYAVEDSVLVLKPVRVVAERGDLAIVRGLADGTKILAEVWAEAREGMEIPQFSTSVQDSKGMPSSGLKSGGSQKNPSAGKE
ncbi:MAG: HlyD family efflux transporter periplasmic adaptor subunit [Candidatus Aminicenantes bacterium]|nr:HlyD family efflux transporter periplasmic adaptor subunit [Candidatus Aminicenantes bacterium]NIM78891.1 HlyD family efflux transporter periplasmic adaptor subunit [Candidatus Aminicenantes bacterium]NIN18147.1 HlyD family efflux transporter periplasmic adaptor subunit [Candidatus Aminicenantes bacterium]NIN42046.1 HlyD family efflux transporter periplasmic adaptor subunit [Candidatus Aminicenantes bacterium]NIN84802.1 HlyD family efflux transporter periplasmic adaptor subunit [Candidatus A